jgi:putative addiction module component (TIGR02574 family)
MSFTEVMEELPSLTVSERQWLVRCALELDEAGLTSGDDALVEKRLADHRLDPGSAVPLDEMKARLRTGVTA